MKCSYSEIIDNIFGSLYRLRYFEGPFVQLKEHHLPSFEHCRRTCAWAIELGCENEVPYGLLYPLGLAGFLHDIGKKDVPLGILTKPGRFTTEEKEIVRAHASAGYLFAEQNGLTTTKILVVGHHEYHRIEPYPRTGKERRAKKRVASERRKTKPTLEQLAMMVALADMYDALSREREYKPALAPREIERVLADQYSGNHFYLEQVLRKIWQKSL